MSRRVMNCWRQRWTNRLVGDSLAYLRRRRCNWIYKAMFSVSIISDGNRSLVNRSILTTHVTSWWIKLWRTIDHLLRLRWRYSSSYCTWASSFRWPRMSTRRFAPWDWLVRRLWRVDRCGCDVVKCLPWTLMLHRSNGMDGSSKGMVFLPWW